ncbi:peptidoglycan-binding protein [Streptomyces sp. NPDC049040]|uniref:peptidoglycan-binding protein n=1 Tax=Streptomyces sp. NPDC049040 TaxID=3365593 RepID=UPI0037211AA0
MPVPVFEDVEPPPGCGCEGCARQRLAESMARDTRGVGSTVATRALVVAAAAGTALGGASAAVAAVPRPAGVTGHATGRGTHAVAAAAAPLRLTRARILQRARTWVTARVPYSMTDHWKDGYRQDCSGFVSMAWGLGFSAWTGNLPDYGVRITRAQLRPGDILLFHNRADPQKGSHTLIFTGWANAAHTRYTAYEQTAPGTRAKTTPYAYWDHSAKYIPYRYRYLAGRHAATTGGPAGARHPGGAAPGGGRADTTVTRLGTLLIGRGAGAYYRVGPGPSWSSADRDATAAFQRAQGWKGSAADGVPGPTTWSYLLHHKGHDIANGSSPTRTHTGPDTGAGGSRHTGTHTGPGGSRHTRTRTSAAADTGAGGSRRSGTHTGAGQDTGGGTSAVPPYPEAGAFRPGARNDSVLALGRRLVAKGFGAGYRPSGTWRETDRREVEAFQRAQGWTGRAADGHPGPETWRRLFS